MVPKVFFANISDAKILILPYFYRADSFFMTRSRKRRNQEKKFLTSALSTSPLTVTYIYETETESWGATVAYHNSLVEFFLEDDLETLFTSVKTFTSAEYPKAHPSHIIDRDNVPAEKQQELATSLHIHTL